MSLSEINTIATPAKSEFYNWDRYWKPVEAKKPDFYTDGFLIEKSNYFNTHLKELKELKDKNYLILIGEPRLGKTTTTKLYVEKQNELSPENCIYIYKPMQLWNKSEDIESFLKKKVKKQLKKSDKTVYLYLDGLDECRLKFETAASSLIENLKKLNKYKDRLKIRITCRTADLPDNFKTKIQEFYEEENNIFELVTLTKEQVLEAAKHKEIENPDKFIEDLVVADAVPFAIVPLTLNLVLDDYKENNLINADIKKLYSEGAEKLLSEVNPFYNEVSRTGNLSCKQKLTIAARIAAISMFCDNGNIAIRKESRSENLITFDVIGCEEVTEKSVQLNSANIEEVLYSALFTSAGSSALTFSHKSYAEFLAAYCLYENKVPLKVTQNLFFNDLKKVHPQLKEVAVWYTHCSDDFLDDLMEKDYEILLDKNTNHISAEKKEKLIDRYIEDLNVDRVEYKRNLKGFVYDGLSSKIIKEFNNDPTNSTKSFLINLAHLSKNKKSLEEPIFKLFSTTKSIYIKQDVVKFIDKHCDNEFKKKLIPLLKRQSTFEEDKEDQLRGIALDTIYELVDFKELLSFITNRKNERLTGNYSRFIEYEFLPYSINHSAKTLLYFANNYKETENVLELIGKDLVGNAVSDLSNTNINDTTKTEIEDALVRFIVQPIIYNKRNSYIELVNKDIKNQKPYKYEFLKKIIGFLEENNQISNVSSYHITKFLSLFTATDLKWLLNLYQKAIDEKKYLWFWIIKEQCFNTSYKILYENIDSFYEVYHTTNWQPFIDYYQLAFKGVALGSTDEEDERWNYGFIQKQKLESLELDKKEKADEKKREEKFSNLVKTLGKEIERFNKGEFYHWYSVVRKIKYENFRYSKWVSLSEELKASVINTAKEFLKKNDTQCNCDNENCEFDGYVSKAFNILLNEDKSYLENPKDSNLYEKWAEWILFSESVWLNNAIIKLLYDNLPAKTVSLAKKKFKELLQEKAPASKLMYFFRKVSFIQDQDLNTIYQGIIVKGNQLVDFEDENFKLFKKIAKKLLKEKHPSFLNTIKEWTENDIKEDHFKKLSFVSSKAFYHLDNDILKQVALMLINNTKLEKCFIEDNVEFHEHSGSGNYLPLDFSTELSKLDFVVLMNWFKHLELEYNAKENSIVSNSEISAFKNGLLDILISKSTDFTVFNLLNDIKTHIAVKDKHLIDRKIRYAIKAISLNSWVSPSPNDFLESIKKHKRLIQTEKQLAELVYEMLEQLQKDLKKDEVPIERFWNSNKAGRIPKSEDAISNEIKIYLKGKLIEKAIIVNREPQVNTKNSAKGKSADFFVEAIAKEKTSKNKQLTVVIEAKGSWHKDIRTSMETQLVNDYLKSKDSKNGIYLIYYVLDSKIDRNCKEYKSSLKSKKFITLDGYKNHYNQQAKQLSEQHNLNIKSFVLDCTFDQLGSQR